MSKFVLKFFQILVCFFLFSQIQNVKAQCTITIAPNVSVVDGASLQPGDKICIESGNRAYLLFKNLTGTELNPITIVNSGGQSIIDTDHFYGIKFSGCKFVRMLGNGINSVTYGFKIKRVGNGAGISVDDMSTNIEIAWTEISHTAIGGIYAKTDPSCDFRATRDKFTMFDLEIHDCYLHDIADEGMYIGSSKFTGQSLADCDTVVLPHIINGVKVYNNILENTGWDGIQVSSAPTDCEIYGNTIRFDSYRETQYQMSGILIGGGSKCDCYNNRIFDGKGDGIDVFGSSEMKIYNNLIVRAGRTYFPDNQNYQRHGIFFGIPPDNSSSSLVLLHNTIVEPKTNGIRLFNDNSTGNIVQNNIITEPGAFTQQGDLAYVNHAMSNTHLTMSYNLFLNSTSQVLFLNHQDGYFDLKPGSPAVNSGIDLGNSAVLFDIDRRERPFHNGFDKGAFECHDPYAGILNQEVSSSPFSVYPNPADNFIRINNSDKNSKNQIKIFDSLGRLIANDKWVLSIDDKGILLYINNLTPGVYKIQYVTSKEILSGSFIKK
jgi:parallel beta-helix repeat protein